MRIGCSRVDSRQERRVSCGASTPNLPPALNGLKLETETRSLAVEALSPGCRLLAPRHLPLAGGCRQGGKASGQRAGGPCGRPGASRAHRAPPDPLVPGPPGVERASNVSRTWAEHASKVRRTTPFEVSAAAAEGDAGGRRRGASGSGRRAPMRRPPRPTPRGASSTRSARRARAHAAQRGGCRLPPRPRGAREESRRLDEPSGPDDPGDSGGRRRGQVRRSDDCGRRWPRRRIGRGPEGHDEPPAPALHHHRDARA